MNVLFCTQSESLQVFDGVRRSLAARLPIDRAGFTVADSWAYGTWLQHHREFEHDGHLLLKEWEVTAKRRDEPDLALLARYERNLGTEAGLFGALVADRRLYLGRDCTYSEDNTRRFSDRELLSILQAGLKATERLFDELKPDLVVGFICVTMLDYLSYMFARARGIRYLNLRPTRVANRVTFGTILNDPTPEFVQAYTQALARGPQFGSEVREYIRRVREQHGRYEGVVSPSAKPALKVNAGKSPLWKAGWRTLGRIYSYRLSPAAGDNHVPDPIRALTFSAIVNPFRARQMSRTLAADYVSHEGLRTSRYAFYPLHTEPEVSLLVYGRPFVNQTEIIRALAMSLPIDMTLVVKEHPWMVGKRWVSFYRNLLNIPRVRLASPELEARELISGASLVAVVTGSVALEAAMLGKPVVTFGDCPYNVLPETMVQRCRDVRALPSLLQRMIDGYISDERALEAYLSATWQMSEGVNLYSALLKKPGVHRDYDTDEVKEVTKLADYLLRTVTATVSPTLADCRSGASW